MLMYIFYIRYIYKWSYGKIFGFISCDGGERYGLFWFL